MPKDKRQVVRRRTSPPGGQIVEAAQDSRACESPSPIVSIASGKRLPGKVSRAISRAPLTLDMTVVCTSGVAATSAPPPPGTSGPAVVTATVTSDGIDVSAVSSVVAPVPVLKPPSTPVGEWVPVVERPQPSLSEPPDLLPVVEVATALPSSPLSPLLPNRVQAGRSQDVPDEGSLFNVSLVSPGFWFRPSRGDQPPPSEGVLLPTTLDDFDDLVLGDPIMYAHCEQFPGSESPLSLPVYAWPSGYAYLLEQSLLQTVLASGVSSQPEGGTSAVAPPMDLEDGRLLETGLPGCPYRFSEYGGKPFSDGNPAFGLQLHHPQFLEFVGAPESAQLLDCSPTFWVDQLVKEQAMAAAVNLQRDAGIMLSNLQILSQFTMSLHRMSFQMMVLGIGQSMFPQAEIADLRAARAATYMSAMGLWRPQMGPGDPGPVPASSCRSCMSCKYCFPEDQLPPE